MIIPLSKLFSIESNKYFFVKASMGAVDKVANIKDYPEKDLYWKVVPNILKLQLEGKIQAQYGADSETDTEEEVNIEAKLTEKEEAKQSKE